MRIDFNTAIVHGSATSPTALPFLVQVRSHPEGCCVCYSYFVLADDPFDAKNRVFINMGNVVTHLVTVGRFEEANKMREALSWDFTATEIPRDRAIPVSYWDDPRSIVG